MSNIELPVEVDNFDSGDDDLSKKDLTVIAGHTFRSYRIASSSFYMGQEILLRVIGRKRCVLLWRGK